MKPIAITGIGCTSAIGQDFRQFASHLLQGTNGIRSITRFDTSSFKTKIAAEIPAYDPLGLFSKSQLNLLDRYSQLALIATREAVTHSQLSFQDNALAERTAVVIGTGIGGQDTQDLSYQRLYSEKNTRLHPFTIPKLISSAAASHISIEFGLTGPVFSTTSACASSGHAVCTALMMLRSGMVDVAIAGGAEAPLTPGSIRAWEAMRIMAKDTCRPFSAKRGGMVLGEGAGTVILETVEHAQQRGATIYAVIAGCGMSADANNMLQPTQDGAIRAMKTAMNDAELSLEDIQYINAHGTGTAQNDPTESAAIRILFQQHADKLAVSSTKSMHGHTLGAAAILELIAVVTAIQEQTAPPTINYLEADPQCDLDYVPNTARPMPIAAALSNSFAFGGLNTTLAIKKYENT
jgi:nodulation protein E